MPVPAGVHKFGPANASLTVRTGRTGAASKAGHDLRIEVTAWDATLDIGRDPARVSLALDADATALRVLEGTGGMQSLGDDDKESIRDSIDDDVLKRKNIVFRSTAAQITGGGDRVSIQGDLELVGTARPVTFELTIAEDDRLTGRVTLRQTDWGIKPYSILFGALKVADEVVVAIDAPIPAA